MDNKNLEQRLNRTSSKRFDWKSLLAIGVLLTGAYYAWNKGMDCTYKNKYTPQRQQQEKREENEQKEERTNQQQSYFSLKYNN